MTNYGGLYIYRDDFGNEAYKIVRYYKKDSKGNIVLKLDGKKAKEFIAYKLAFDKEIIKKESSQLEQSYQKYNGKRWGNNI